MQYKLSHPAWYKKSVRSGAYSVLGEIATAPGARTSFFLPETRTLYVAIPHRGKQKAELRVFMAAVTK
jgi:hypothetical protein